MIYRQYLYEPNGYRFNYESGRFRTADGRSIDLALVFTCRQVAEEMQPLPFETNTINFYPIETQRVKAGQFHRIIRELDYAKMDAVRSSVFPEFATYLTAEANQRINKEYPQFVNFIPSEDDPQASRRWRHYSKRNLDDNNWGFPRSVLRSYLTSVINELSANSDFLAVLASWKDEEEITNNDIFELDTARSLQTCPVTARNTTILRPFLGSSAFRVPLIPWLIPSDEDIFCFSRLLDVGRAEDKLFERSKFRFSAAAAAISFLNSLSSTVRRRIRRVVLHENDRAVADPESHGLGFIPYCRENLQLKVERRVNIWRTVTIYDRNYSLQSLKWNLGRLSNLQSLHQHENLMPVHVGKLFADWIVEASLLPAAGMPEGSFSLIFDADPLPNQGPGSFELAKLSAAWQQAANSWHISNGKQSHLVRTNSIFTIMQGFPEAVTQVLEGSSLVTCDFPIGQPIDQAPIFEALDRSASTHVAYLVKAKFQLFAKIGQDACRVSQPLTPHWLLLRYESLMHDSPLSALEISTATNVDAVANILRKAASSLGIIAGF